MSTSPEGPPPLSNRPQWSWARVAQALSRPLERFLRIEAASGIVLLVVAAVALLWANSPWSDSYFTLWHTPLAVRVGGFTSERSLQWFVNDALMVIFFFVVGLEIRREVHHGELSQWRRAALPAAAALGGMLAPAGLYLLVAGGAATRHGWGVPMATDIAFAVGVLTLLGSRVPPALRVLLLALAVIDDLGAIVVIALFYSSGIAWTGLAVAAAGLGGIFLLRWAGVRTHLVYVVPAAVVWGGILAAGIHPTIAGVLVGLVTPVVGEAHPDSVSPAEGLIDALHPWVAYGIMPVFALANAGVVLGGGALDADSWKVAGAVALGLVLGKPLGVGLACWLALKLRVATLPLGIGGRQLLVLGLVAGVGFTMALFIAQLAFAEPTLLAGAKVGVLAASAVAGVVALLVGRALLGSAQPAGAAKTVDEAEQSTET